MPLSSRAKIAIGATIGTVIVAGVAVTIAVLLIKKKTTSSSSLSPITALSEVYCYNPSPGYNFSTVNQAASACQTLGAVIATPNQLQTAYNAGAEWCTAGFLSDGTRAFPMQHSTTGCYNTIGVVTWQGNAGATCYGVKPAQGTPGVINWENFAPTKWSQYS